MILTTITLSVTLLLVASPILFLISATPAISSSHQIDDCGSTDDCSSGGVTPPIHTYECTEDVCKIARENIRSRINWSKDACGDFKSFCCSDLHDNKFPTFKTPQEIVDNQILGNFYQCLFIKVLNFYNFI
jgi:hypothetical protein